MAFLDLNGLTAFKGKVDEQSVIEYTCVTTGTVHALTSSYTSNNIKFVLDSAFNTGDTFTVNGTAVTAKMQSGGDIKPNSLSVGVMAFAILSGTTLVFVGGGSSEVESVFGRTGNIVADKTDYQDYYLQAKLEDATDVPEAPNFAVPDGITIQQSTAGVWKATNNMLRKGTDSTDGGIIAIPIDAGTLDGNDSEYFAKSDAIGAVSDLTTTAKTVVPAINELKQDLTAQKVYGGEVTPSAIAPGATGTVTIDLSAQFSSITSVSATVNALEPQIYPVGAMCSGTTVTVYVHNGSQDTLAPTAYYMVIGSGK